MSLVDVLFKILAFPVAISPSPVRERLGVFLGWVWFDLLKIRRRVALQNLEVAFPEKGVAEREQIARESLHHLGRTLVDFARFPFVSKATFERELVFEGVEHLQLAASEGKGVLILGLHLGNGDFAMFGCASLGYPFNLISKQFKTKWLNDLWFRVRGRLGLKFIMHEKSSFDILRALKRKEYVIFVLDQFMGPPIGVKTRFFNAETGTAAGLALMHLRTNAPVVPGYCYRRDDGRVSVVFESAVPLVETEDHEKNISFMTQAYTDRLEAIVRKHPKQWMWIHRRWKEFS